MEELGIDTVPVLVGPVSLPAARQVRRRRARGLRPPQPARAAARGLRRGARAPRGAGGDLGAARRAVLRRGPLRARARRAAARLRGARQGPRAHPDRASRPTSTTSATPTACSATCPSRASGWTSIAGRKNVELIAKQGGLDDQYAVRRDRRRPQRVDQRPRAQPRPARGPARPAAGELVVSTSCSLLHTPIDLDAETRPRRRAALVDGVREAEGRRGRDAGARPRRGRARRSPPSSTPTTARSRTGATPTAPATRWSASGSRRSTEADARRESPFDVAPRGPARAARPAAVPDHDDRLLPADRGDPPGARRAARGRDRRGRVRGADALRDRARDRLPGGGRPRRARPRRARAQRHGPVLRRADGGLRLHPERLGAVVRLALRAPADHLRRRQPARRR